MRTAALICEFNPFHNGHAYVLHELRRRCGADFVIALMSGNYVQRGEPAIFDKYTRTRMALTGGGSSLPGGFADLVLEMPPAFSTSSAAEFANAGVVMALKTGVVDTLGFGVEKGTDISDLKDYLKLLETAVSGENELVRDNLKSGMSYPKAVSAAVLKDLSKNRETFTKYPDPLLNISKSPNNILGIEYLRALKKYDLDGSIEPAAIERAGGGIRVSAPGRGDSTLKDISFTSASALRNIILSHGSTALSGIRPFVPEEIKDIYESITVRESAPAVSPDDLSLLLSKALLDAKYRGLDLCDYQDVSREIAGRLLKTADRPSAFTEKISEIKTKQYTYTRISRALLHISLSMTKDSFLSRKEGGYIGWLKILGFRKDAAPLLRSLKESAAVPVITKTADRADLLRDDICLDELYYSLRPAPGSVSEYERSPVIL